MTRSRQRVSPDDGDDAVRHAGWLYTDLVLGLMVVFLGAVVFRSPTGATTPASTTTTSATIAPTTTTAAPETEPTTTTTEVRYCPALANQDQLVVIEVDRTLPNDQLQLQAGTAIMQRLAELGLPDTTRFGFALVFAGPDTRVGPSRARDLADRLAIVFPLQLALWQYRPLGDSGLDSTTARVELFPIVLVPC